MVLYCIVLYCTVLYQIHCVVLDYIIWFYSVLHYEHNISKVEGCMSITISQFYSGNTGAGFNPLITISITLTTNVHTECMMPFLWPRDGIG